MSKPCNNINLMNFLTNEANELNLLVQEQRGAVNYSNIVSWLKPTRTYASSNEYKIVQRYSSYTELLENVIDRIYLILNIVYIKLEKLTATCRTYVKKPVRLTIASLGRVIIDKLNDFNTLKGTGGKKYQKDVDCQTTMTITVIQNTSIECTACVTLFKCLSDITFRFKDSLKWLKTNAARRIRIKVPTDPTSAKNVIQGQRLEVRSNLYKNNNSQSMRKMCDAIVEDLTLFLDNNRVLNESHAALNKQYDNLIDDYIDYIAECDANFARNEGDNAFLVSKVNALHNAFASKLQLFDDSFARIFAEVERFMAETNLNRIEQDNAQRINNDTLNCALLQIAQHLETLNSCTSVMLQKIIAAIDICTERMLLLQSLLQNLQINVAAMHEKHECTKVANVEANSKGSLDLLDDNSEENNPVPVRDMLNHIEMNKSQIIELQNQNVELLRTIERIKKAVMC